MRQRLRYRFDNLLARGTWATLVWLGIITLVVLAVSATALAIFDVALSGSEDSSYMEDFWQSLLRVLDTGTMAGDVGWGRRVLALIITIFGVLVAGTLIGVIAAGVEDRIERMRRGRSVVFEDGHVVILGASNRLPMLVRQLVLARAHLNDSVLVVMADRDPAEMQDAVRRVVNDYLGTRVVYRAGDPTHPADLEMVRLAESEMVIILADNVGGDSRAIRTLIAVDSALGGFETVPAIVEVSDVQAAQHLAKVYPNGVHVLVPHLAVGRIATFALRETGVGQVATSLLDDQGSDVHVSDGSAFEGLRFDDVRDDFPVARPLGILRAAGTAELNPPPETRFERGDRLVLISDRPEGLMRSPAEQSAEFSLDEITLRLERPEQHLLIVGWSDLAASMLADWAAVTAATSTAEVLLDPSLVEHDVAIARAHGPKIEVIESEGVPDLSERLARSPRIDTIVMCAVPSGTDDSEVDSRTLLDLVAIRRTLSALPGPTPRVLLELLDADNIPLAHMPNPDDFVVSEALASQLLAQLAEQPERRRVLLELYDTDGPSIHLVPAGSLGLVGGRQRAMDVFRASHRARVTALGWRFSSARGGELVINPERDLEVEFDEDDRIVVIG